MVIKDIVVVGAGIVGLSSAVAIQENCPGVKVTIVADKFTRHTTSDGSGGIFVPTAPGTEEKIYDLWAREGAKHFFDLAFSEECGKAGINLISGFELDTENKTRPFLKYMLFANKLPPLILERFSKHYKSGYFFTTVIVEGPKYLPWLMDRFVAKGGKIEEKKIYSFEELCGKCDLVVNCTGLGSKELTSDSDLQPWRGHIIRATAPWIKHFFHSDDNKYILPASETIAVGGFRQTGRSDLVPLPEESRKIWEDVKERFPALEGAKILWEWVGLRPGRSKVRLESEVMHFDGKSLRVIHNYGHGAYGISLSWGTGYHVAQMVQEMVNQRAKL